MMPQSSTMPASIWSQTTTWELALFAVGVLFTLALLGLFIWITFRAGREERERSDNEGGGASGGQK